MKFTFTNLIIIIICFLHVTNAKAGGGGSGGSSTTTTVVESKIPKNETLPGFIMNNIKNLTMDKNFT